MPRERAISANRFIASYEYINCVSVSELYANSFHLPIVKGFLLIRLFRVYFLLNGFVKVVLMF